MTMQGPVRSVLRALLSLPSREITLDELGAAIGDMAITPQEIEALIDALESEGRTVAAEPPVNGAETLKHVLAMARAMKASGRVPSATEIATATGLPLARVRHALALARVMAR